MKCYFNWNAPLWGQERTWMTLTPSGFDNGRERQREGFNEMNQRRSFQPTSHSTRGLDSPSFFSFFSFIFCFEEHPLALMTHNRQTEIDIYKWNPLNLFFNWVSYRLEICAKYICGISVLIQLKKFKKIDLSTYTRFYDS